MGHKFIKSHINGKCKMSCKKTLYFSIKSEHVDALRRI